MSDRQEKHFLSRGRACIIFNIFIFRHFRHGGEIRQGREKRMRRRKRRRRMKEDETEERKKEEEDETKKATAITN